MIQFASQVRRSDELIRFAVRLDDGSQVPVDAVLVAPGLAVHPDVVGQEWTITHIPSGRAVLKGLPRAKAVTVGLRIAPFEAWSERSWEAISANQLLVHRVVAESVK